MIQVYSDATCPGKKLYKTRADAKRDVRFLRKLDNRRLRIYWCEVCKHYHLATDRRQYATSR